MSETRGGEPFQGKRLRNPTKAEMAFEIADALGIDRPPVSRGASVDSTFLDRIHTKLTGDESVRSDAYRKVEQVLQDLGLTYDPFWDTSESAETGGSTVTNRAYSRIRTAITGIPRCFLLYDSVGMLAHSRMDDRYHYDVRSAGRSNLTDAGPGARALVYGRDRDRTTRINAHGEVAYIEPGWAGPWTVNFTGIARLNRGISFRTFGLPSRLNDITEISYDTYRHMLIGTASTRLDENDVYDPDPGGDVIANRVLHELPLPLRLPVVTVPNSLPQGHLKMRSATVPTYRESRHVEDSISSSDLPPPSRDRAKAKAAEERAVRLAHAALETDGWRLLQDRQKHGVGYDLAFEKNGRELHVEVKGIMGNMLAFNVTPKEAWRLETDPAFVVIAVTNVLSPKAFKVHLLTRDQLAAASRVITGYRLRP